MVALLFIQMKWERTRNPNTAGTHEKLQNEKPLEKTIPSLAPVQQTIFMVHE